MPWSPGAPDRTVDSMMPLAVARPAPGMVPAGRPSRPVLRLLAGGAASPPSERVDRLVAVTDPSAGENGRPSAPGAREPAELDELVRRSQRGDRAAFSELFRRHRGDVSRLVFRMLGPTADAEDV